MTTPWTVDDLINSERVVEFSLSASGRAAWVQSTVRTQNGEAERILRLWMAERDGIAHQLTRSHSVSQPRFSPDETQIAYLSDRPLPDDPDPTLASRQLWMLPVNGGEPYPVTRLQRQIQSFAFRDDQRLILRLAEAPGLWEQQAQHCKDTTVVVEDARQAPVRLFELSLPDGPLRRLTSNNDWINQLAVSPDGCWAMVTAQRSLSFEYDAHVPPRSLLLNLHSGVATSLFEDGRFLPQDLRWSPDSQGVYFTNCYSRHPRYRVAGIRELHYLSVADGSVSTLLGADSTGVGDGYRPTTDGAIVLAAAGITNTPLRLYRDRRPAVVLDGIHADRLDAWELATDGVTLAYQHSTASTPPQWYRARLEDNSINDPTPLTHLNPGFAAKQTGRVEVLRYTGSGHDTVEAILHYPMGWKAGADAAPLVLFIHGGPAARDQDSWRHNWPYPIPLFQQRGAFVLQVNYHGSTGYGLDFVESISDGRYCEDEIPDLLAGIELLVRRGWVDEERLGTLGWSNGGILSAELITRDQRFKAASLGAADVEWISDWANVDFGACFDHYYFGCSPFEHPQLYLEKSSFFRLPQATTPTIVFTGTQDRAVPTHQSWNIYRAMQQAGRAPVRLVLFPNEGHGLNKIAHQRRKVEEELTWFDLHLFHRPGPPPAVKPGSRLAALGALAEAAHDDGCYGYRHHGLLLPETVPYKELILGRFLVTQAQWGSFDHHYPIPVGQENYPATNLGEDRIDAYLAWLQQHSGQRYRLLTAAEQQRLSRGLTGGNTLDYWADYSPNPNDSTALQAYLSNLAVAPRLLTPVDQFPGVGEPMVFDLHGNAATWVDDGGERHPQGACAIRAAGDHDNPPPPSYVGLRLVRVV